MTEFDWEMKRALRIELLGISDQIQTLSVMFRNRGLSQEYAIELNGLQIKVGELIGKIMTEK